MEVDLEPIYDRVREELVVHHLSPSFADARADTMRMMLDYIEDRYVN